MDFVDIKDLRAMLERAFEEGWRGYLGMKEECVSRIISEAVSSSKSAPTASFTLTATSQENIATPYYSYSTMTLPPPEIVRREEIV